MGEDMSGDEKILVWDGVTVLDIPIFRVLRSAEVANLSEVVVIGFKADGGFFFTSSKADGGDVIYLLELAKKKLLEMSD